MIGTEKEFAIFNEKCRRLGHSAKTIGRLEAKITASSLGTE